MAKTLQTNMPHDHEVHLVPEYHQELLEASARINVHSLFLPLDRVNHSRHQCLRRVAHGSVDHRGSARPVLAIRRRDLSGLCPALHESILPRERITQHDEPNLVPRNLSNHAVGNHRVTTGCKSRLQEWSSDNHCRLHDAGSRILLFSTDYRDLYTKDLLRNQDAASKCSIRSLHARYVFPGEFHSFGRVDADGP